MKHEDQQNDTGILFCYHCIQLMSNNRSLISPVIVSGKEAWFTIFGKNTVYGEMVFRGSERTLRHKRMDKITQRRISSRTVIREDTYEKGTWQDL
jgi:hypothetical protein